MITPIFTRLIRILDALIEWSGRVIAWLTLFMVLAVVLVLILRHGFSLSAIPLKESVTYMHALVFMLGAAYTLKHNGHVRVDVFYQKFTPRRKAWVEIFGFVFLLVPVCWFIYHYSVNTVALNWALKTGSNDPGGIPYLYLLMGLLLLLPISLFLQGLSNSLKNLLFLLGKAPDPNLSSHLSDDQKLEQPHA
ncbi:TRAP transporter small permease subunit [Kangiella sp. TOML190]|uniref:TRAP transporter small permease subunit n=1 Tax=Kangiella sp. TOML190 TaxID=2931351 RepID=UPI00203DFC45|nr:TRAP transporter small permease subunit [Kangiella sp. TOML190]